MLTIDQALKMAIGRLMGASGSPRLDAQLLLAHVLAVPREMLIAHPERTLSATDMRTFEHLLTLRTHGMPIAYLLGTRPFYDRLFRVTPHVLIPRPETELLVQQALDWARKLPASNPMRVLDVGTGAGVIAVTLAAHLPLAQVIGSDVSSAALSVAQVNAEGVFNVGFVQADLLAPFAGLFQIIASNLPYIATADLSILDVAHFEPHVALDGGRDGLKLIGRLLDTAPKLLATPGLLLIEHGADQGAAALALARQAFPDAWVTLLKDDAGLDRAVKIETGRVS